MGEAKDNGKAWVVMPLYYYPLTEKTWQPLYDAYVPPTHTSVICERFPSENIRILSSRVGLIPVSPGLKR
jgi:hypothetical protein